MIRILTAVALLASLTGTVQSAELNLPLHPDEAAILRGIIDVEKLDVESAEMPGYSKNGVLKLLEGHGVDAKSLQTSAIALQGKPQMVLTDGIAWKNNETYPERGNISSVVWTGERFLAVGAGGKALESPDGLVWKPQATTQPKIIVRAGETLFGWSWPPTTIQHSRDAAAWQPVANEKSFHVKHIARGLLGQADAPHSLPAKK